MNKSLLPLQSNCGRQKKVIGEEDLVKLLRWHFGHSDFRGKQLEAIEAVLSGRDCFCLMPTGGGKSMCYQVPALTKPGIVLVVSPLIALMENQVSKLKEKEIPAEFLSSTQTVQVKNKGILRKAAQGWNTCCNHLVIPEFSCTTTHPLDQGTIYSSAKWWTRSPLYFSHIVYAKNDVQQRKSFWSELMQLVQYYSGSLASNWGF